MTLRPLDEEGKVFDNHSHIYITCYTQPRLRSNEGLL